MESNNVSHPTEIVSTRIFLIHLVLTLNLFSFEFLELLGVGINNLIIILKLFLIREGDLRIIS